MRGFGGCTLRWVVAALVSVACAWLGLEAFRTWRATADRSLAQDYALRGGARAAAPYLVLAAGYRPDDADPWRLLSGLRSFSHPRSALRDARRAVAADPADWRNWDQLGLVQFRLGDLAAAQRSLRRAVGRDSGWRAHYRLGNLALLLGQEGEFWVQMRAALAVVPADRAAPVFSQAFAVGGEGAGGRPRWVPLLPTGRAQVESVGVGVLLREGKPGLAALAWEGVSCAPYQVSVCRTTSVDLANRLAGSAFKRAGEEAVGSDPLAQPAALGLSRDAAEVWDAAVARGWVRGDPARAGLLGRGGFRGPWSGPAFRWEKVGPVYASTVGYAGGLDAVRLDFTGYEPERTPIFRRFVLVRPGGRYLLAFESRMVGGAGETGVDLVVRASPRTVLLRVPARLGVRWQHSAGEFRVPGGVGVVQVSVRYRRPAGEVRLRGSVLVSRVRLRAVPR